MTKRSPKLRGFYSNWEIRNDEIRTTLSLNRILVHALVPGQVKDGVFPRACEELPLQVKRTRDVLSCGKLGIRDICIKTKTLQMSTEPPIFTFVFASAIAVGSRVV